MPKFTTFQGRAVRVDQVDIAIMAHRLGVEEDKMQAVKEVEASKSGFDAHGRPKMLFEPHVFYRHLDGKQRDTAVSLGLAHPEWLRGYPKDSYPRLRQAYQINPGAALKSASWGAGQILGSNHVSAGYGSVEAMVEAFMDDEENHYEAMVAFILDNRLDDDIRRGDWRGFARGYNGPRYAENGYHTKLERAYNRWRKIEDADAPIRPDPADVGIPNGEAMKRVQTRLRDLGYFETGTPDGVWGYKTRAAILAFRADNGLPLEAKINDLFLVRLAKASKRPIGLGRATATVADLRDSGSETITRTDATSSAGKVAVAGGGLLGGLEAVDAVSARSEAISGLIELVQPGVNAVQTNLPFVLIAGGAFVVYQMWKTQQRRVSDHREGKHVGR